MKQPHDPEQTADIPSQPADSLDAGLAAGFGRLADRPSSVLSGLREAFGPLRPVLLKEPDDDSAPIVKPRSDVMPLPEHVGERYQLAGEIARGGMGAVLRGRDVDLGRDLAVKVLLEKYVDRPEVARRFIEEAQIGGQLQHPGVVPVYDIGRFGDRPFFTMKLVKGLTLAALLRDRPNPTAGGVPTDTPRFLAIALQVAQTLAYAHAKGVIHRDLKPANIMVGAFGEVQVMDWGLAKVLAEGGIADERRANREHQQREDETTIRTARSSGSTGSFGDTEAGSILGTPAYMPPEQANGESARLDRRADVFGLGAILCEVLTGRPPYVGQSYDEVRRKAANGNLSEAHAALDHCGADAELIKLTRACLCAEAADRPKDARAVAEGLTAYLNGVQARLRQAELAEAEAKTKAAEEAKRRRLRLTLAATVVVAVLGGVVGTSFYAISAQKRQNDDLLRAAAERERQERNAEAVAGLLDQAFAALQASDADKAEVLLGAAGKRLAEGGADELSDRRGRLQEDLAVLRELDQVDQFRWTSDGIKLPDAAAVAARLREVLRRFGLTAESVPVAEAAARVSGSAVRHRLVAALDRWMGMEKLPWLQAVLRAADPDPYRDALRAAFRANDGPAFVQLVGQEQAAEQPPGFIAWIGERAIVPLERRRDLLTLAVRQRPGDLGLLMKLGDIFAIHPHKENAEKRLRWRQAAVAVAPRNVAALNNLGVALIEVGQLDEAIACFRTVIELNPNHALAHSNLGRALAHMGQFDEAIACCRTAIALDRKCVAAHAELALALTDKGQLDEAIACCRTAIALDPNDARGHSNLGAILCDKKRDYDGAIACFRKAIEADPKHAQYHFNLGNALKGKGQWDEAIASFKKAIELDPKLAPAHSGLGAILCDEKRDYDGAVACFRKAIEVDPKFAQARCNLGIALAGKSQWDEAIASYRTAIELNPKFVLAHYNLGKAHLHKGQWDKAIASLKKAIELDPKLAPAHNDLGAALAGKGQLDDAIASYRTAIKLEPKLALAHSNLGTALEAKGQLNDAIASYRTAIELDPNLAGAHHNLGNALNGKGLWDEAIASFKKAIELDPQNAICHTGLGAALAGKGQLDAAIASFKKAIELDPKFAKARTNLALAQRQVAIQGKLAALLKGEYKPSTNDERLILAELCLSKKMYRTAASLFADAIAADPKLADDLKAGVRYNAACCAALTAAGKGAEDAKLDDAERVQLRKQALDWLRADLALQTEQLASGPPANRKEVQQMLQHWQEDSDLAGVREEAALAKLPAAEQAEWEKLWNDVAALLKKPQQ